MSELTELLEVTKEILKWIKFANFNNVKNILETILSDGNRILVYHLSDGTNTTAIIASKTPVSTYAVSTWWRAWAKIGIISLIPVKGGGSRGKKMFDLEDFDIAIPKIIDVNDKE